MSKRLTGLIATYGSLLNECDRARPIYFGQLLLLRGKTPGLHRRKDLQVTQKLKKSNNSRVSPEETVSVEPYGKKRRLAQSEAVAND